MPNDCLLGHRTSLDKFYLITHPYYRILLATVPRVCGKDHRPRANQTLLFFFLPSIVKPQKIRRQLCSANFSKHLLCSRRIFAKAFFSCSVRSIKKNKKSTECGRRSLTNFRLGTTLPQLMNFFYSENRLRLRGLRVTPGLIEMFNTAKIRKYPTIDCDLPRRLLELSASCKSLRPNAHCCDILPSAAFCCSLS